MAYFAQAGPSADKPRGKAMVKRTLSPSRLKRGPDREEMIDKELEAFHGNHLEPGKDFLLSKLDNTAANTKKGKNMQTALTARTHQSNIFAEARINTPPKLRIRPNFSEEQLAKIAAEDNRREEAAVKMASNPTLVDKMYSCNYPMPHAQEVYIPQKKRFIDQLPPAPEEVSVAGFKNMGQMCKPLKYPAKAHHIHDPFIPELPVRKERMPRYGPHGQANYNPITNIPNGQQVAFNSTPRGTNQFDA